MTEDRESANQDTSAADSAQSDSASSAASTRPTGAPSAPADDPHPFDRPGQGDAQFQGPDFSSGGGEEGQRPPFGQDASRASGGTSGRDPFGAERRDASGIGGGASLDDLIAMAGMGQIPLEMAKDWVRKNQTTSMIGAFAVGVFIGAMTRD